MKVHPTALVDPGAVVAGDVEIGPFCSVGPDVRLGSGCRLTARVRIEGSVTAGRGNVFHPNVVVGGPPSEPEARPAPGGRVEIGEGNVLREGVAIQMPMTPGGVTRLGSNSRLHTAVQVGHDCWIGDHVCLGSFASLEEHVVVENDAWIEGLGTLYAYVTVGRRSWVRSQTAVEDDVPPFMWGHGARFEVKGVNPRARTEALERAYRMIWCSGLPHVEALARLDEDPDPQVAELAGFLRRSAARRTSAGQEGGGA